jgi:DNA (cytosine-5)-methyltransferase 1
LRAIDLFSGIGGFSLGLERAGMETVAFCEIDPFCRRVLAKHWPGIPCYDDVRTLTAARLAADGIIEVVADAGNDGWMESDSGTMASFEGSPCSQRSKQTEGPRYCGVDLICGGFPCQDISVAGKGAGIDGARSGLWSEYARIIGEVRPCYVIVENVAALLGRGLARVLGDLAALGFDAEWHCISASAVGAPHRRDRVWIVAKSVWRAECARQERQSSSNGASCSMADSISAGLEGRASLGRYIAEQLAAAERGGEVPDTDRSNGEALPFGGEDRRGCARSGDWWLSEPEVGRVAHGVHARVDRLRSLGNAVVPQIPELIGRAIMAHQSREAA